ncbi:heparan-alpha-glucosaminide N-acetyltransferase domain-containing protein [Ornithinimicrobium sp. Y1847]|uniref:heparan-alpha-glucosaminide N-acetyltransferase domain-containing protein n=1 Tax=unclassified Ornithinimicrobium TaxID=2615080 RepID=UPI003B683036
MDVASLADRRIVGVDLARMVALLGMFAAHIVVARDAAGPGGVDPLYQVVAGRSSALFALLAGVGLVLATRRVSDVGRARVGLVVRAVLIAALGIVLGSLDSGVAVILTFYGALFLCALPVLTWSARSLAWLAVGWGLLSPVVSVLLRRAVEGGPKVVPSLESLDAPGALLRELLLTGYYPVLTWATYLFAGMALARIDLRASAVGPRLMLVGAWLAALSLGVSAMITRLPGVRAALIADPRRPVADWAGMETQLRIGLYGTHPDGTWWWLGVWSPHSGSIVDLVHTTGCALLVLGLCLWVVRLAPMMPWRIAAGAGAMTLSLYAAHVAILATPLGDDARPGLVLLAHCVVAVALGSVVAAMRWRGPLEWLVARAVAFSITAR